MGRKKRPLWKLWLDPTAYFCLWLESEGYTSWVISRGIRACSLIKSSRKKVARISNKGLFLSFCLPPDGGSQAPAWDASLLLVPRAAPTVLRYVDLWLPGGWGILLYRHKDTSSENQSPLHPWCHCLQAGVYLLFLKGFASRESAGGTYKPRNFWSFAWRTQRGLEDSDSSSMWRLRESVWLPVHFSHSESRGAY